MSEAGLNVHIADNASYLHSPTVPSLANATAWVRVCVYVYGVKFLGEGEGEAVKRLASSLCPNNPPIPSIQAHPPPFPLYPRGSPDNSIPAPPSSQHICR